MKSFIQFIVVLLLCPWMLQAQVGVDKLVHRFIASENVESNGQIASANDPVSRWHSTIDPATYFEIESINSAPFLRQNTLNEKYTIEFSETTSRMVINNAVNARVIILVLESSDPGLYQNELIVLSNDGSSILQTVPQSADMHAPSATRLLVHGSGEGINTTSFSPINFKKDVTIILPEVTNIPNLTIGTNSGMNWTGEISEILIYDQLLSPMQLDSFAFIYREEHIFEEANKIRDVYIDFSTLNPVQKSMSGFIHGMNSNGNPPTALIAPLSPRTIVADNFAKYERAHDTLGAKYIFRAGGAWWGHPDACNDWPFDCKTTFFEWTQGFVKKQILNLEREDIYWTPWNEANGETFWVEDEVAQSEYGTTAKQAYFDTYKVFHDAIVDKDPNQKIGGPECFNFDRNWIIDYLDFCLANKLKVDFLSFHQLGSIKSDYRLIEENLQDTYQSMIDNPKYDSLGIEELLIDEYIDSTNQNRPASTLASFYYLEKGKADGACRSCWHDLNDETQCWNNSITGLLTNENQKRSTWWVHKTYADGVASRVNALSSDPRTVCLASANVYQSVQLLIGSYENGLSDPTTEAVLHLNNLDQISHLEGAESLLIEHFLIPEMGETMLEAPIALSNSTVSYANSLDLPILTMETNDVVLIKISKLPQITSIEHINLDDITLFPNPTTYGINVNTNGIIISQYEIIDVYGRSIMKQSGPFENLNEINVETLPSGYYYLTFKYDDRISKISFMKI